MGFRRDRARRKAREHTWTLLKAGRGPEALAALQAALERFPNDPELHLFMGFFLVEGDPTRAAWYIARAIEVADPEHADHASRLVEAAHLMVRLDRLDDARDYTARARRAAPPDFVLGTALLNLMAKFAAIDGDDVTAEDLLRQAAADPEYDSHAADLVRFLIDVGRISEARKELDAALRRFPESPPLLRLQDALGG